MDDSLDKSAQIRQGEALLARLAAAGYLRAEPPILQPASVFLDQSGEDIRGRLYLTGDAAGTEFCLRPDYTIPVLRIYLASAQAGRPAAFSYLGPVFRFRSDGPGEFVQAGLESFGRTDREAADAEILSLALEAAQEATGEKLVTRIGDAGLFSKLLDALDLSETWKRRLRRGHARSLPLDKILSDANGKASVSHAGVLAALANADRSEARSLVEDLLSIAGINSIGGRTASEIADRYLEQASMRGAEDVSAEQRRALERFLSVAGEPDESAQTLRGLAADCGLNLHEALDEFENRLNFIAARGVDLSDLSFSTRFGRHLDYYTGFVFEAARPARPNLPVVGGGRYDRLSRVLGAREDVPAVGAAIWCERLRPAKPEETIGAS